MSKMKVAESVDREKKRLIQEIAKIALKTEGMAEALLDKVDLLKGPEHRTIRRSAFRFMDLAIQSLSGKSIDELYALRDQGHWAFYFAEGEIKHGAD